MTKSTGQRQYRACIRCRKRKTKCDLPGGSPPCDKCGREGAECVLAGSRRGGDYSHFRSTRTSAAAAAAASSSSSRYEPQSSVTSVASSHSPSPADEAHIASESTTHGKLQNPSDALLILAHSAEEAASASSPNRTRKSTSPTSSPHGGASTHRGMPAFGPEAAPVARIEDFPLVKEGILTAAVLEHLVTYYSANYHAYFPIVPSHVLQCNKLAEIARAEPFLLTTILAVASRDRLDLDMHPAIWRHLDRFILDISLGKPSTRHVGYVEGLLLLSEWTPLREGRSHDGGENAAWSLVGLAVRLAYLLRLEETLFRERKALDAIGQRRRVAWAFTYMCDRQISIRMGQAFWSRGPSLSDRFKAADFPTLQASHSYEEDFASFLQAQMDLTALYGNAHDILFASKQRTAELIRRGDYGKYIYDTRRAIIAWDNDLDRTVVSHPLRCCLEMMKQYLRLYVNSFAFHARLFRSSSSSSYDSKIYGGDGGHAGDERRQPNKSTKIFPDSTITNPDAWSIYQAFEGAEDLLKIAVEDLHPEKHLRYMPARFYLYAIHSAVFLYKAFSLGAVSMEQRAGTALLVRRFISTLRLAATDENHIASKYATLIEGLWDPRQPNSTEATINNNNNNNAAEVATAATTSAATLVEEEGATPNFGVRLDPSFPTSSSSLGPDYGLTGFEGQAMMSTAADELFTMPGVVLTEWEQQQPQHPSNMYPF